MEEQKSYLPAIDFSKGDLKPGSEFWRLTSQNVRHALEEYGCFVAVYDNISSELCHKIFSESKDIFELPKNMKMKNFCEKEPYKGYLPPNPIMPLYEGLAIDNATSPQETHKFMNLMWPQGKHQFCEVVGSFAKLLAELEEMVIQMLFESYGAKDNYESIVASNSHLLRFIKYKESEENNKKTDLWFTAHTDRTFATMISQDEVAGLEVKSKEGSWLSIASSPSHFVFMAGCGLQVWSNDRVKACYHRVKYSAGSKARYSIALLSFNNGVIEVPQELVDDEHPLEYNPFDSRGFLGFHITNLESPVKAYCGVNSN